MTTVDQIFLIIARAVNDFLASTGVPAELLLIISALIPAVVILAIFGGFFAFVTWLERKMLSRMQNRLGPNRVGPYGLLQPIADGLKMLTKEDIVPRAADKLLHGLAPIMVVVPTVMLFSLLPYGRDMIAANVNVGVLMFFAVSSTTTLALFMAGWGSRNKYSILGAMRAIAQMISYELPVVMTAVPAIMIAGSLNVGEIVAAQSAGTDGIAATLGVSGWFVWQPWGLVGFLAFFVAGMAELNRSPFDIAEGESEIVAGFHTEYSGFKFALFYLGEYLAAIAFSGLAATLFLGGWQGPAFLPSWLIFFGKMFALIVLMIWIRGTFPRLRADQLMGFSWKFLLPLAFVNIIAAGTWFHLKRALGDGFFNSLVVWLATAALLVPTYLLLARINSPAPAKKREYKYADL